MSMSTLVIRRLVGSVVVTGIPSPVRSGVAARGAVGGEAVAVGHPAQVERLVQTSALTPRESATSRIERPLAWASFTIAAPSSYPTTGFRAVAVTRVCSTSPRMWSAFAVMPSTHLSAKARHAAAR